MRVRHPGLDIWEGFGAESFALDPPAACRRCQSVFALRWLGGERYECSDRAVCLQRLRDARQR